LDSIYKTSWGYHIDLSKLNAVRLMRFVEPSDYCRLLLYFALTTDPVILETNVALGVIQEDEIVKQWKKYKGEL